MSLFSGPAEHAANPPESWVVTKHGERCWDLGPKDGGAFGAFPTKAKAEQNKVKGFYFDLWCKEKRWYAGESIPGWKPYGYVKPTPAPGQWAFNRKYEDLEQVAEFLPDYERRLAELTEAGKYPYNDSFKGHIPGIAGPHEDTGIYLLQGLGQQRREDAKIVELLAEGYRRIEEITETLRCKHIVLYPQDGRMSGSWGEHRDARLVGEHGRPYAVLPKGKRTNGYLVAGRGVLVMTEEGK